MQTGGAGFAIDPDAGTVMVGFGRVEPDLRQITYTWENDRTLNPVGGKP